jgi:hypothetical protein
MFTLGFTMRNAHALVLMKKQEKFYMGVNLNCFKYDRKSLMSINLQVMKNSLIALIDNNESVIITGTDPRYMDILKVLSEGFDEDKIKRILFFEEISKVEIIHAEEEEEEDIDEIQEDFEEEEEEEEEETPERRVPRLEVLVKEDKILIDKIEMPECLKNKFLELKRNHKPRSYLLKFWDNLQKNPNRNSIQMLYKFLEHNGHPVMGDGCFIAYKAVTKDLKDHHTKTNVHKLGCVVRIDREKVNPDPNQTCSSGLHVCSWAYLKDFNADNSRWFEVLVNPKDVVAVPVDYNGTKMRVAAYKVYREVKSMRDQKQRTSQIKILKNKIKKMKGIQ